MNLPAHDGHIPATRPKALLSLCRYTVDLHTDNTLCESLHDVKRNTKGIGMKSQQTQIPLLVSKKEASVLLGVCPRTIDNFVARKELPCRRIGRRTLIPYQALLAFAKRDHVATAESQ